MSDAEAVHDDEVRMTLVEHLTELRDRLIKCVVAVALGGTVAWAFYPQIFEFLLDPYTRVRPDAALFVTDPLEGFSVRLKVAGYGGLALAMPVVLWQIWRFVTPGLYPNEKRYAVPFVLSSLVLFFLGAGLAYWTLPRALDFLTSIGGENLQEIFSPSKYLTLITYMMLAFGIGFEFPILLVFLQLAGILSNERLRSWRRYAYVGVVVLVAVITPSGDPYSLLVLSLPMVMFYEASLVVGRLVQRRRDRVAT